MTTRALVLAGGGIRVAWQAGVVAALRERDLTFAHGDATSGGIFTLGMLMSGVEPDEMGERWRTLNVRDFLSLLPLRTYLRPPTSWPALGSADGIREKVLPHLGIDVGRIRAADTMSGSFNVADFGAKRCVAVPHTEVDLDRLVAGVSLPGVMPAVRRDGRTWTDAVWIQDANLMEAVRRGCNELWVAWCIGDTERFGDGLLEQYVHMIELSATGALVAELERIAELNRYRTHPVVVHLVKPSLPLPLDPEFVFGRIDAETLVAMGYRDAHAYLDQAKPGGIELGAGATSTPVRRVGARLVLRTSGDLDGRADCTVVVEADDLEAMRRDPHHRVSVVGGLRHQRFGYRPFVSGELRIEGVGEARRAVARAALRVEGQDRILTVEIPMTGWSAAREHLWSLAAADGREISRGRGQMSVGQAARALASFEPSGAHGLTDRWHALQTAWSVVRD